LPNTGVGETRLKIVWVWAKKHLLKRMIYNRNAPNKKNTRKLNPQ